MADINPQKQNNFSNPGGKKDGQDPNAKGKPRFSLYWIYGIIALTLIGMQMLGRFGNIDMFETTEKEFKEVMVAGGDVSKYVILRSKGIIKVYIKGDSALKKPFYKQKFEAAKRKLPTDLKLFDQAPLFQFDIGNLEVFQNGLTKFSEARGLQEISYKTEEDPEWIGQLLNILIWVLLFVGLWVIMMRKMGGPSGAGGPGGIFNIGKSKAQLFEKGGTKVNITFTDVAGLDEAKVEVMEIVDFLKNPKIYCFGWQNSQRCTAGWPSWHRQNIVGQSHGRRGASALL
jgi:AFG3 family protein